MDHHNLPVRQQYLIRNRDFEFEPVRVFFKSRLKDRLTVQGDLIGAAVMDLFRGEHGNAAMAMLFVVPVEKVLAKRAAVLDAAEVSRELRAVLEGFELGLRIGVVVADVRPAMGFGDSQIGEHLCNELGFHAGSPIRMDGELSGKYRLLRAAFFNQPLGQGIEFPVGYHPADH